jgi:son of sevenless-like protein
MIPDHSIFHVFLDAMAQQDTIERIDSGCHDTTTDGLVQNANRSAEMIKAGTLPALVENLTRHDKLDGAFNRTFLVTYKYFTSGAELLSLLIDRFDGSPPPHETEEWSTQIKPLIRLRVVNIMRQWLEHFWGEPKGSDTDELLRRMQSFAERAASSTQTPTQQLNTIIQRRLSGHAYTKKSHPSISNPPKPILPRKLDKLQFTKIDAKEIARQLTIMEAHMFNKLEREELLNKNWQKKTTPELAPNVRALIRHSNQLSNWVCATVLAESDLKKRAQVVDHLVSVANVNITLFQ